MKDNRFAFVCWNGGITGDIAQNYDVMFDSSVALYKVQAYGGDQIITLSNRVEKGEGMAQWFG